MALQHLFILPLACSLLASPEGAAVTPQPSKRPWSEVITLSFVNTSGNAEGRTIGFSNEFTYRVDRSTFVAKAGFLRVASASTDRSATGNSLAEAVPVETHTWKTTADSYYLNLRNDNRLPGNTRWYWFSGVGWERNRPAGLEDRFSGSSGFGRIFLDTPRAKFRTDLGFGFSDENPVVDNPNTRSGYWTANLNAEVKRQIAEGAHYTLEFGAIEDLSDSSDRQFTLKHGLSAALNKTLALKLGYEMKYRNRPNLIAVTAYSTTDSSIVLGDLYIPARKLDTLLTTSLVATF